MHNEGSAQYRQMEWFGFGIEHRARRLFNGILSFSGRAYGNTTFDAVMEDTGIDLDLKGHVLVNAAGALNHKILANARTAMDASVAANGVLALLVLEGHAVFDLDGLLRAWRIAFNGGLSKVSLQNIAQGRRRRLLKTSVRVTAANIYLLDADDLASLDNHAQGRQANGASRKAKYALDTRQVLPAFTHVFEAPVITPQ
jgi:hypothetical protein